MSVVGFVSMFANLRRSSRAVPGVPETGAQGIRDGSAHRRAFIPVGFAAFATLPVSLGAHYLGFPVTVAPLAAALCYLMIGQRGSIERSGGHSGRGTAFAAVLFVAAAGALEAASVIAMQEPLRAPLSLLATLLLVATPYARLRRDALRRLDRARDAAERQSKLLRSLIDDAIAVVDRTGRLHAATDKFYDEPDRAWPTDELLDRVHVLDRPKLLNALDRSAVARRPACIDVRIDRSSREEACSFSPVHLFLAPMPQSGLVRLTLDSTSQNLPDVDAPAFDGAEECSVAEAARTMPQTGMRLQAAGA